jgi:glucosyl-dolichyl phosphate glucuronosyltransferase
MLTKVAEYTAAHKQFGPRQGSGEKPKLSPVTSVAVVIPTKDRPDDLESVVKTLLKQTVLPMQLIVVDQSVSSTSEERVKKRFTEHRPNPTEGINLVYLRDASISGASAARNRSLGLVRAGIVLFLDDDVLLDQDFVQRILEAYEQHPNATGVSGIVTNYSPPPRTFRWWSRLFIRGPLQDDRQPIYWSARRLNGREPIKVTRLGGGLMSFRMSSIGSVRFDEKLTGTCDGEDVDFCMHLGRNARLLITPAARLLHKQSSVGRASRHWLYLHARTNWYLYRRNWNHGLWNRLCFLWLNIGYAFAAFVLSIHEFSTLPFENLLRAVDESRALVSVS